MNRGIRMSSTPANESRAAEKTSSHLVFLIPGLLGFDSFSMFSYFADRACAALCAGLGVRLGERIDVIPLPVPPVDSLAQRQVCLLRSLIGRTSAYSPHSPPHVHLVGHSTGGVDALLLTRKGPLVGKTWQDLDVRAPDVLASIKSVVTISSPHQGACIAKDPVAELLRAHSFKDVLHPKAFGAMPSVGKLLFNLVKASVHDPSTKEVLASALLAKFDTLRYLQQVVRGGALVEGLHPGKGSGAVSERSSFREGVQRRSYVTISHAPEPGVSGSGYPDELFRDLSLRASGYLTGCTNEGDRVEASVHRLERAARDGCVPVIRNFRAQLPHTITAGHNDGIVNSARQLFDPNDEQELSGIIVGDHYDVIGHYDRRLWTIDANGSETAVTLNSGLLHSGSAFGDEQFFELWGSIAQTVASAALAAGDKERTRDSEAAPGIALEPTQERAARTA